MLRTGTIWWHNKKTERTLNNTDTTTEKRTKNGFRKSKKQSNVLSNSGYKPWYYATFLRIWGWPFKGYKQIPHHPSFPVIMNTHGELEHLTLTETPRALLKNWEKIRKFETNRLIVSHYKSFRDPEIGENVSYHLKAMVAENQLRAFTDLYSTVWAFSSREAVQWLWGREYSMVWTLRMRTISP